MQLVVNAANEGINLDLTTEQIKNKSYEEVADIYQQEVGTAVAASEEEGGGATAMATYTNKEGKTVTADLTNPQDLSSYMSNVGWTENQAVARLQQMAPDLNQSVIEGLVADALGDKPSEGETDNMKNTLEHYKGEDGYIKPGNGSGEWGTLKQNWKDSGHTEASFINEFSQYINPANPQDYGNREKEVIESKEKWGGNEISKENILNGKLGITRSMLEQEAKKYDKYSRGVGKPGTWFGGPKVKQFVDDVIMPQVQNLKAEGYSAKEIVQRITNNLTPED